MILPDLFAGEESRNRESLSIGQEFSLEGIALIVVIMIVAILLAITGAALLFSGLNLKIASNLRTGGGAIHAADAGIQHGLALIPAGGDFNTLLTGGVSGFTCASPCNGTQNKPTLTGSLSGYTYSVVAENDPGESASPTNDSNQLITLTSTATGPGGSKRKVKAYIGRSSSAWTPPGAIYMPGAAADMEFRIESGSIISGDDTNINGTAGPLAAIPGIATNNAATTAEAIAAVEAGASVTGGGGTPSVVTTSSTLDITALVNNFLANPNTVISGGTTLRNGILGTWATPQITHVTGDFRVRGTSSGAGVLIVDGNLRIEDTFDFKGLIILRNGGELRLEIGGSAPIYGAILLQNGVGDLNPELIQTC